MIKTSFTRSFLWAFAGAFSTLIFGLFGLSACGNSDEEALAVADSFSVAYFNWQFQRALPFVTDDSRRWLSYAASQVDQTDVDSLRAMAEGARCEVKKVSANDSVVTATVDVRNFLALDSINGRRYVAPHAVFPLTVRKTGGQWRVMLTALPRQQKAI